MSSITFTRLTLLKKPLYGWCKSAFYSTLTDAYGFKPIPSRYSVPSLSKSVENYLRYVEPLVTPEQWEQTCKVASAYLSSPTVGRIQTMLEMKGKREDNWLFDWWLSSYLSYRAPVVVHSSPGVRMKTMQFDSDHEWLTHAAKMVCGAIEFKRKLETNSIAMDHLPDGSPMCMSQHYSMLGNCRIPGYPHDRVLHRRGGPRTTHTVGHICVLFRNRIYRLDFLDPVTGEFAPLGLIIGQLQHIVSSGMKLEPGPPAGLLTTAHRDDWARAHAILRGVVSNSNTLTDIERSLIVLCLDESAGMPDRRSNSADSLNLPVPNKSIQAYLPDHVSGLNCLHGNGVNSANRWFDKTLQFIVSRDGSVGINFEHTPADGGAIVSLLDDVYNAVEREFDRIKAVPRVPCFMQPHELALQLTTPLLVEVEQADDSLKRLIEDVATYSVRFTNFGADAIKAQRLSPDAFVQVALQLAYSRVHPDRLAPATYESGSLRRFYLGRTDTIRSCSPETVAFCKSMSQPTSTATERVDLMRKAIVQHKNFTNDVTAGSGFDRHLLGLRLLASCCSPPLDEASRREVDSLFEDPSYAVATSYVLSTSQLRSPHDLAVTFGPVVPNGYGVCYNIHDKSIQVQGSSFHTSSESKDPAELIHALAVALDDMLSVL